MMWGPPNWSLEPTKLSRAFVKVELPLVHFSSHFGETGKD
jgi:hypothetical protein